MLSKKRQKELDEALAPARKFIALGHGINGFDLIMFVMMAYAVGLKHGGRKPNQRRKK
jgi:hypothetical protein